LDLPILLVSLKTEKPIGSAFFVFYDYFNNDNDEIEKLDIMDSVFTINKYYTYNEFRIQ
jgi:hypothetical protein